MAEDSVNACDMRGLVSYRTRSRFDDCLAERGLVLLDMRKGRTLLVEIRSTGLVPAVFKFAASPRRINDLEANHFCNGLCGSRWLASVKLANFGGLRRSWKPREGDSET